MKLTILAREAYLVPWNQQRYFLMPGIKKRLFTVDVEARLQAEARVPMMQLLSVAYGPNQQSMY